MGTKNLYMQDDFLEKIDLEAKKLGLSFSDYVRMILIQHINGFKIEITSNQEPNNVPNKKL